MEKPIYVKDHRVPFTDKFILDGKPFYGIEAHRYLRDNCGFDNLEAVKYLMSL